MFHTRTWVSFKVKNPNKYWSHAWKSCEEHIHLPSQGYHHASLARTLSFPGRKSITAEATFDQAAQTIARFPLCRQTLYRRSCAGITASIHLLSAMQQRRLSKSFPMQFITFQNPIQSSTIHKILKHNDPHAASPQKGAAREEKYRSDQCGRC